jgi:hypothetical protein
MAVAGPILRAVGGALRPTAEVILVPGNHDRALISPWLETNAAALGNDTELPADASPALAAVVDWLGPRRTRVRYPGVWLADGVWATHGHYLDRHLMPSVVYGFARGLLGRPPGDAATPADYESGPHVTRLEAFLTARLPRRLSAVADDVAGALRAAAMGVVPSSDRPGMARHLAPLIVRILGLQMRHAATPALAHVVHRLGVEADTVIFGHVHRHGPRPEDKPTRWLGPGGAPRILNTGCWVYEPLLLRWERPPHPYWPGGAVLVERGRARAVALLDHLDAGQVRVSGAPPRGRWRARAERAPA